MRIFYSFLLLFSFSAFAFDSENYLPDEAQEQRAMAIFSEVKCLVCEAQSIASSNTEFSFKMRELIRNKVAKGESDEQIKRELVEEFGNGVLLSPTLESGWLIWVLPLVFAIVFGGVLFFRRF